MAEVEDGGTVEVWGDGKAVRSYIYVDDLVEGIVRLMRSELDGPVNIGAPEHVTVEQLVTTVAEVAGKEIRISYVDGPVGVQSRNFSSQRIESIGWQPKVGLRAGIRQTYRWVEDQVRLAAVQPAAVRSGADDAGPHAG